MKPNLFKRLKLFFLYRSTIKKNLLTLNSSFNLRKDLSNRLYTVINVPVENFDEPYNIRTSDINAIAEELKSLDIDITETDKTIADFCRQLNISTPF